MTTLMELARRHLDEHHINYHSCMGGDILILPISTGKVSSHLRVEAPHEGEVLQVSALIPLGFFGDSYLAVIELATRINFKSFMGSFVCVENHSALEFQVKIYSPNFALTLENDLRTAINLSTKMYEKYYAAFLDVVHRKVTPQEALSQPNDQPQTDLPAIDTPGAGVSPTLDQSIQTMRRDLHDLLDAEQTAEDGHLGQNAQDTPPPHQFDEPPATESPDQPTI
jgi:hypothetical protein